MILPSHNRQLLQSKTDEIVKNAAEREGELETELAAAREAAAVDTAKIISDRMHVKTQTQASLD